MLDRIRQLDHRMEQIEARLEARLEPQEPEAFQRVLQQAEQALRPPVHNLRPPIAARYPIRGVNPQIWGMMNPSAFGPAAGGTLRVVPQVQSNSISCGQTSVAMAVNALTGKNLRDTDIDRRYGFELLRALNDESRQAGWSWHDGGVIGPDRWDLIAHKVNVEKTPVIVALNGPEFSPSGRGHIVTIIGVEGEQVTYADPADGTIKTTTRQAMNQAPPHPDGNFIFYASRQAPDLPPMAGIPGIPG